MKRKTLLLTIIGVAVLLTVVYSFSESSVNWTAPQTLLGDWSGKQKVTVRYRIDNKYSFVTAPDSVGMAITIKDNGIVSGNFGTATFDNCMVEKNRGWLGRLINIKSDFIITGRLNGGIFPGDTLAYKEISLPFNMTDNVIDGAIFQKQGMGAFPMCNIRISRNR